jgi:hypothetical protein
MSPVLYKVTSNNFFSKRVNAILDGAWSSCLQVVHILAGKRVTVAIGDSRGEYFFSGTTFAKVSQRRSASEGQPAKVSQEENAGKR